MNLTNVIINQKSKQIQPSESCNESVMKGYSKDLELFNNKSNDKNCKRFKNFMDDYCKSYEKNKKSYDPIENGNLTKKNEMQIKNSNETGEKICNQSKNFISIEDKLKYSVKKFQEFSSSNKENNRTNSNFTEGQENTENSEEVKKIEKENDSQNVLLVSNQSNSNEIMQKIDSNFAKIIYFSQNYQDLQTESTNFEQNILTSENDTTENMQEISNLPAQNNLKNVFGDSLQNKMTNSKLSNSENENQISPETLNDCISDSKIDISGSKVGISDSKINNFSEEQKTQNLTDQSNSLQSKKEEIVLDSQGQKLSQNSEDQEIYFNQSSKTEIPSDDNILTSNQINNSETLVISKDNKIVTQNEQSVAKETSLNNYNSQNKTTDSLMKDINQNSQNQLTENQIKILENQKAVDHENQTSNLPKIDNSEDKIKYSENIEDSNVQNEENLNYKNIIQSEQQTKSVTSSKNQDKDFSKDTFKSEKIVQKEDFDHENFEEEREFADIYFGKGSDKSLLGESNRSSYSQVDSFDESFSNTSQKSISGLNFQKFNVTDDNHFAKNIFKLQEKQEKQRSTDVLENDKIQKNNLIIQNSSHNTISQPNTVSIDQILPNNNQNQHSNNNFFAKRTNDTIESTENTSNNPHNSDLSKNGNFSNQQNDLGNMQANQMAAKFSTAQNQTIIQSIIPAIIQHLENLKNSKNSWTRISLPSADGPIGLRLKMSGSKDAIKIRFDTISESDKSRILSNWIELQKQASNSGIDLEMPEFMQ